MRSAFFKNCELFCHIEERKNFSGGEDEKNDFSEDVYKDIYDLHGRMPVIFCWRRMAGFRADIYSELLLQKKALKKTRVLANDGYLAIKSFKRR